MFYPQCVVGPLWDRPGVTIRWVVIKVRYLDVLGNDGTATSLFRLRLVSDVLITLVVLTTTLVGTLSVLTFECR